MKLLVAGLRHEAHRVDPASPWLWALVVQWDAEIEHLAGLHEAGGDHETLRGDQVDRAPLVLLAPAPPVAQAGAGGAEVLFYILLCGHIGAP
jgi:hypothetical protein